MYFLYFINYDLNGEIMRRDPVTQFMKDPDNKAKLFMLITGVMIATTFLVVIGTLIFILMLVGIIQF